MVWKTTLIFVWLVISYVKSLNNEPDILNGVESFVDKTTQATDVEDNVQNKSNNKTNEDNNENKNKINQNFERKKVNKKAMRQMKERFNSYYKYGFQRRTIKPKFDKDNIPGFVNEPFVDKYYIDDDYDYEGNTPRPVQKYFPLVAKSDEERLKKIREKISTGNLPFLLEKELLHSIQEAEDLTPTRRVLQTTRRVLQNYYLRNDKGKYPESAEEFHGPNFTLSKIGVAEADFDKGDRNDNKRVFVDIDDAKEAVPRARKQKILYYVGPKSPDTTTEGTTEKYLFNVYIPSKTTTVDTPASIRTVKPTTLDTTETDNYLVVFTIKPLAINLDIINKESKESGEIIVNVTKDKPIEEAGWPINNDAHLSNEMHAKDSLSKEFYPGDNYIRSDIVTDKIQTNLPLEILPLKPVKKTNDNTNVGFTKLPATDETIPPLIFTGNLTLIDETVDRIDKIVSLSTEPTEELVKHNETYRKFSQNKARWYHKDDEVTGKTDSDDETTAWTPKFDTEEETEPDEYMEKTMSANEHETNEEEVYEEIQLKSNVTSDSTTEKPTEIPATEAYKARNDEEDSYQSNYATKQHNTNYNQIESPIESYEVIANRVSNANRDNKNEDESNEDRTEKVHVIDSYYNHVREPEVKKMSIDMAKEYLNRMRSRRLKVRNRILMPNHQQSPGDILAQNYNRNKIDMDVTNTLAEEKTTQSTRVTSVTIARNNFNKIDSHEREYVENEPKSDKGFKTKDEWQSRSTDVKLTSTISTDTFDRKPDNEAEQDTRAKHNKPPYENVYLKGLAGKKMSAVKTTKNNLRNEFIRAQKEKNARKLAEFDKLRKEINSLSTQSMIKQETTSETYKRTNPEAAKTKDNSLKAREATKLTTMKQGLDKSYLAQRHKIHNVNISNKEAIVKENYKNKISPTTPMSIKAEKTTIKEELITNKPLIAFEIKKPITIPHFNGTDTTYLTTTTNGYNSVTNMEKKETRSSENNKKSISRTYVRPATILTQHKTTKLLKTKYSTSDQNVTNKGLYKNKYLVNDTAENIHGVDNLLDRDTNPFKFEDQKGPTVIYQNISSDKKITVVFDAAEDRKAMDERTKVIELEHNAANPIKTEMCNQTVSVQKNYVSPVNINLNVNDSKFKASDVQTNTFMVLRPQTSTQRNNALNSHEDHLNITISSNKTDQQTNDSISKVEDDLSGGGNDEYDDNGDSFENEPIFTSESYSVSTTSEKLEILVKPSTTTSKTAVENTLMKTVVTENTPMSSEQAFARNGSTMNTVKSLVKTIFRVLSNKSLLNEELNAKFTSHDLFHDNDTEINNILRKIRSRRVKVKTEHGKPHFKKKIDRKNEILQRKENQTVKTIPKQQNNETEKFVQSNRTENTAEHVNKESSLLKKPLGNESSAIETDIDNGLSYNDDIAEEYDLQTDLDDLNVADLGYPKAKSLVETILNEILSKDKSIDEDDNQISNEQSRINNGPEVYSNVVETVLNIVLNNATKEREETKPYDFNELTVNKTSPIEILNSYLQKNKNVTDLGGKKGSTDLESGNSEINKDIFTTTQYVIVKNYELLNKEILNSIWNTKAAQKTVMHSSTEAYVFNLSKPLSGNVSTISSTDGIITTPYKNANSNEFISELPVFIRKTVKTTTPGNVPLEDVSASDTQEEAGKLNETKTTIFGTEGVTTTNIKNDTSDSGNQLDSTTDNIFTANKESTTLSHTLTTVASLNKQEITDMTTKKNDNLEKTIMKAVDDKITPNVSNKEEGNELLHKTTERYIHSTLITVRPTETLDIDDELKVIPLKGTRRKIFVDEFAKQTHGTTTSTNTVKTITSKMVHYNTEREYILSPGPDVGGKIDETITITGSSTTDLPEYYEEIFVPVKKDYVLDFAYETTKNFKEPSNGDTKINEKGLEPKNKTVVVDQTLPAIEIPKLLSFTTFDNDNISPNSLTNIVRTNVTTLDKSQHESDKTKNRSQAEIKPSDGVLKKENSKNYLWFTKWDKQKDGKRGETAKNISTAVEMPTGNTTSKAGSKPYNVSDNQIAVTKNLKSNYSLIGLTNDSKETRSPQKNGSDNKEISFDETEPKNDTAAKNDTNIIDLVKTLISKVKSMKFTNGSISFDKENKMQATRTKKILKDILVNILTLDSNPGMLQMIQTLLAKNKSSTTEYPITKYTSVTEPNMITKINNLLKHKSPTVTSNVIEISRESILKYKANSTCKPDLTAVINELVLKNKMNNASTQLRPDVIKLAKDIVERSKQNEHCKPKPDVISFAKEIVSKHKVHDEVLTTVMPTSIIERAKEIVFKSKLENDVKAANVSVSKNQASIGTKVQKAQIKTDLLILTNKTMSTDKKMSITTENSLLRTASTFSSSKTVESTTSAALRSNISFTFIYSTLAPKLKSELFPPFLSNQINISEIVKPQWSSMRKSGKYDNSSLVGYGKRTKSRLRMKGWFWPNPPPTDGQLPEIIINDEHKPTENNTETNNDTPRLQISNSTNTVLETITDKILIADVKTKYNLKDVITTETLSTPLVENQNDVKDVNRSNYSNIATLQGLIASNDAWPTKEVMYKDNVEKYNSATENASKDVVKGELSDDIHLKDIQVLPIERKILNNSTVSKINKESIKVKDKFPMKIKAPPNRGTVINRTNSTVENYLNKSIVEDDLTGYMPKLLKTVSALDLYKKLWETYNNLLSNVTYLNDKLPILVSNKTVPYRNLYYFIPADNATTGVNNVNKAVFPNDAYEDIRVTYRDRKKGSKSKAVDQIGSIFDNLNYIKNLAKALYAQSNKQVLQINRKEEKNAYVTSVVSSVTPVTEIDEKFPKLTTTQDLNSYWRATDDVDEQYGLNQAERVVLDASRNITTAGDLTTIWEATKTVDGKLKDLSRTTEMITKDYSYDLKNQDRAVANNTTELPITEADQQLQYQILPLSDVYTKMAFPASKTMMKTRISKNYWKHLFESEMEKMKKLPTAEPSNELDRNVTIASNDNYPTNQPFSIDDRNSEPVMLVYPKPNLQKLISDDNNKLPLENLNLRPTFITYWSAKEPDENKIKSTSNEDTVYIDIMKPFFKASEAVNAISNTFSYGKDKSMSMSTSDAANKESKERDGTVEKAVDGLVQNAVTRSSLTEENDVSVIALKPTTVYEQKQLVRKPFFTKFSSLQKPATESVEKSEHDYVLVPPSPAGLEGKENNVSWSKNTGAITVSPTNMIRNETANEMSRNLNSIKTLNNIIKGNHAKNTIDKLLENIENRIYTGLIEKTKPDYRNVTDLIKERTGNKTDTNKLFELKNETETKTTKAIATQLNTSSDMILEEYYNINNQTYNNYYATKRPFYYGLLRPVKPFVNKTALRLNGTCGVDNAPTDEVLEGHAQIEDYPWLGSLIYPLGKQRLVTTVILISNCLVIASAFDIHKLPKNDFRRSAKVVLGHNCTGPRLSIVDYNYHPEFRAGSSNALAYIQIEIVSRMYNLRPICAPPAQLNDPEFFTIVMPDNCKSSKLQIYAMEHVPIDTCRRFYRDTGLDIPSTWPRFVACGRARWGGECLWRTGTILVVKQNSRWHLVGFGVMGPGCEAPSRYIDFGMYLEWVKTAVARLGQPAVTRLAPNQIILRRSNNQVQRYGPCDAEEMSTQLFSDTTEVYTSARNPPYYGGTVVFNLTIVHNVDYHCVMFHAYNLDGLDPQPTIELRRYCLTPQSFCPSGFGLSELNLYVIIRYIHSIKYKVQAYGSQSTSFVDSKSMMSNANEKTMEYPLIPLWEDSDLQNNLIEKRAKVHTLIHAHNTTIDLKYGDALAGPRVTPSTTRMPKPWRRSLVLSVKNYTRRLNNLL